jgi:hypothetical protein
LAGEGDAVALVELELAARAGALGVGGARGAGGGGGEGAGEEVKDAGEEGAVEVRVGCGEHVDLLLEERGVEAGLVEQLDGDVIEGDVEDGGDGAGGANRDRHAEEGEDRVSKKTHGRGQSRGAQLK